MAISMRTVVAALVVSSVLVTNAASAAPLAAERCAVAYETTQRLRETGKLLEAATQAQSCAEAACPRVLRQDCARWVDEIDRLTPTIVIHATGADGCDVVDGRVTLDGAPLSETVTGGPVRLDPGVHSVRIQPRSGGPIEQRVVVIEGDRGRRIELSAAPLGSRCETQSAQSTRATTTVESRPVPPLAYVLGGIGAASLVTGTVVALTGLAKKSELDACRPGCDPADVDAMRRTFLVSDVLIGVGIVAVGVAAYVYLGRPTRVDPAAAFAHMGTFRF